MTALLLAAQFLVTIAMIGTILLQRSEGGALGLGGGGGVSGLMSGRGAANALSRLTVFLGAAFIAISLALALIAKANSHGSTIATPGVQTAPGVLPGGTPPAPAPLGTTPAAPTGSTPTTAPAVPAVPVPSRPAPAAPAGGGH
jgi:preprotein translocase subunit SecG